MELVEKEEEELARLRLWYFGDNPPDIDIDDTYVESHYHIPSELLNPTEPMDIPSVGNSEYFSFAPVRRHQHPTNPDTNGLISSRILPDGSNTFRLTTALSSDFVIPETPDDSAKMRMMTESFNDEYSGLPEKPTVLTHGEVNLSWKE